MLRSITKVSLLATLPAIVAGCGNQPASIEVEPTTPRLSNQQSELPLQVVVKAKNGKVLPNARVDFKTLTPQIIAVDASGTLKAVHSGNGTVLVKAGKVNKEVEVIVQIAAEVRIEPPNPRLMLGVTRGFKATVYNDRERPMFAGEIRWSSSDPAILTVDHKGNVKTVAEGEATLTAHAAGISGSTVIVVRHEVLHDDGTLD